MKYKKCSRKDCGAVLPYTEEYFKPITIKKETSEGFEYKWKGFRPECRECTKKDRRKYYQKNRKRLAEYHRNRYVPVNKKTK